MNVSEKEMTWQANMLLSTLPLVHPKPRSPVLAFWAECARSPSAASPMLAERVFGASEAVLGGCTFLAAFGVGIGVPSSCPLQAELREGLILAPA